MSNRRLAQFMYDNNIDDLTEPRVRPEKIKEPDRKPGDTPVVIRTPFIFCACECVCRALVKYKGDICAECKKGRHAD